MLSVYAFPFYSLLWVYLHRWLACSANNTMEVTFNFLDHLVLAGVGWPLGLRCSDQQDTCHSTGDRRSSFTLLQLMWLLFFSSRALFKLLSKEITPLQLLLIVIGWKILYQFINQWKGKPKPIATCTCDFFARFEQVTWNCYEFGLNWFFALFALVVIVPSNYFGICFTTLNWKSLYSQIEESGDEVRQPPMFLSTYHL